MAVKIGLNGWGRIGRYLARLMVGDKDSDLQAAARAGVRALHFTGGNLAEFLKGEVVAA